MNDAEDADQGAGRRYHHGDLRHALLEATLSLISEKGARALSLREVARITGVSHPSVYRHFPSKEALMAEIAEQGYTALSDAMLEASARFPEDPVEALNATGVAYVRFGVSSSQYLQVMFGGVISDHSAYPGLAAASRRAYDVLKAAIARAQPALGRESDDPEILAIVAWAKVHGLAVLLASHSVKAGEGPGAQEALIEAVVRQDARPLANL